MIANTSAAILQAISRSKTRSLSVSEIVRALGTDRAAVKATVAQLLRDGTITRALSWSADVIVERWMVTRTHKDTAS